MERVRPEESTGEQTIAVCSERLREDLSDSLRWYCKESVHTKPTIIREESLHVTDLGTQLKPIIQKWMTHEELRKCPECGVVSEAK